MPEFSEVSKERLYSCHQELQYLFNTVIQYFDCTIAVGFRDKVDQDKAIAEGRSKDPWPTSKHNQNPSHAIDVYPYPVDLSDLQRIYYFAGRVMGIAEMLKFQGKMQYRIRWGGDWNRTTEVKDNKFNDLGHFELIVS